MSEKNDAAELEGRAARLIAAGARAGGLARGALEAVRALERREARLVFLAADADRPELLATVRSLARATSVPIVERHGRAQLGRWAGIERPAGVVAITSIHDREVFLTELLTELPTLAHTLGGLQTLARAALPGGPPPFATTIAAARAALTALEGEAGATPAARADALADLLGATLRLASAAEVDLATIADRWTLAEWLRA